MQVLYQLKIFTTALFSVSMLGRSLLGTQWISLALLFVGVSLVTFDSSTSASSSEAAADQNVWVGIVAVIISCVSSGFAGVYFEKILKGTESSVWLRNVQLGIFGGSFAFIGMLAYDGPRIRELGFFHGYSPLVFFVVTQQAIGGLIVALVVKYADNILKGYATSLSIIISAIASVFLLGFKLTVLFGAGSVITISAVVLYGYKPTSNTEIKTQKQEKSQKKSETNV